MRGYSVYAVNEFTHLQNEKEIDRLQGANAPELTKKVTHHASTFVAPVTNIGSDKKEVSAPYMMQKSFPNPYSNLTLIM